MQLFMPGALQIVSHYKPATLISFHYISSSLSCANLEQSSDGDAEGRSRRQRMYSASAPASTNSLLGNFEVSRCGSLRASGYWKEITNGILILMLHTENLVEV